MKHSNKTIFVNYFALNKCEVGAALSIYFVNVRNNIIYFNNRTSSSKFGRNEKFGGATV